MRRWDRHHPTTDVGGGPERRIAERSDEETGLLSSRSVISPERDAWVIGGLNDADSPVPDADAITCGLDGVDAPRGEGRGAVHERTAYYGAHRLQNTVFEIAAKITDDLKFGDEAGRRIMFPQVLGIVRRYVETRVQRVGASAIEKIALEPYRSTIISRVSAAIRPADDEGEQPLPPVLHDMAGIGSTDVTPFLTIKPCLETVKSHLSKAVVDSGWERQVARALDESPRVCGWVKNARLDFTIPYEHQGRKHDFIPDFVVDLRDGDGAPSDDHLVVEVKGLEREADRSKDVGARRWIAAVNHWGKLGRWRYAKIHSPHDLISLLGNDPGPGSDNRAHDAPGRERLNGGRGGSFR